MIIYKFSVPASRESILDLPKDAQFLDIQFQNELPVMWILGSFKEVEKGLQSKEQYTIRLVYTHEEFDSTGYTYVGTYQVVSHVVHLFFKKN